MEFTKMFRHPKYYKELRKRNRDRGNTTEQSIPQSDQAISSQKTVDVGDSVRPGPGLKQQASSAKPQAPSSDKNL